MTFSGTAQRPVHVATVVSTESLAPDMIRVVFTSAAIADLPELAHTDTYVKLLFGDAKRAYTIRWLNRDGGEMAIDFVVHGDEGLAGPWAAAAQPGDEISFVAPSGDWAPRTGADAHLFVGDEAAIPAIAASLERLASHDSQARARVFLEVASARHEQPMPQTSRTEVVWVHRDQHEGSYGPGLVRAVVSADLPEGDLEAFVHGNADMVRPLRRHLLKERGIPREHVSISGYWRAGHTDESWRALKREFNAAMDAD
ncbi:MAG: siderophore-interacting protein [Demequina sp.]